MTKAYCYLPDYPVRLRRENTTVVGNDTCTSPERARIPTNRHDDQFSSVRDGRRSVREGRRVSVVAESRVDRPEYASVLDEFPGTSLTVEGMTTSDCETLSMVLWAEGTDFDAFETALERTDEINDVEAWSESTDGCKLYRMRLPVEATDYRAWAEHGGALLGCTLDGEGMVVRMRFPDREALVDYRRHCRECGCSFELRELTTSDGQLAGHDALTSGQRALLTAAVEGGYFEIPREISMSDLAARFGISDQAASERLRRALSNTLGDASLDRPDVRTAASVTR